MGVKVPESYWHPSDETVCLRTSHANSVHPNNEKWCFDTCTRVAEKTRRSEETLRIHLRRSELSVKTRRSSVRKGLVDPRSGWVGVWKPDPSTTQAPMVAAPSPGGGGPEGSGPDPVSPLSIVHGKSKSVGDFFFFF